MGLGGAAFRGDLSARRPAQLVDVPPMRHDRLVDTWSGGDLVMVVGAQDGTTVAHAVRRLVADAAPFARLRWEVPTPTGTSLESGLLFLSHQAHVGAQFVPLQQALDESDALNEWTTAIGSGSFALLPGFAADGWLGESVLG